MEACVERSSEWRVMSGEREDVKEVEEVKEAKEKEDTLSLPQHRASSPSFTSFPSLTSFTSYFWLSNTRAAEKLPHIVNVDVDAFFASVEQVLNPKLQGKPVLVGRGVVASASYEAKFRGVKTAMSFRDALRICPKA